MYGFVIAEYKWFEFDLIVGFLAWSFITSLDIAALFGSADGQLIDDGIIVSLLILLLFIDESW